MVVKRWGVVKMSGGMVKKEEKEKEEEEYEGWR